MKSDEQVTLLDFLTPEELKDYRSLTTHEAMRLFMQYKLKRSFKALVWLLGYHDIGVFHLDQIEKIGRVRVVTGDKSIGKVRRLWLWSRGFFKTSLITVAHSIYLIINNPNIRILIASYTIDVSSMMLQEIKGHFTNNEAFRYFFKEFCPKSSKEGKIEFGTTEKFVIPNRTKLLKEPTMMCAGCGTNLTGCHFDYIKPDDIENEKSVTNEQQIKESKDFYASLRQLYDNPSTPREDFVGTIYHFNGLCQMLTTSPEFEKSIIPIRNSDGKLTFPERWTAEAVDSLFNDKTLNPYIISCQYFLTPCDPAEAKFKQEWWKTYLSLPTDLMEYICVDPASTQTKHADYTVMERWGVDSDGFHYLLEGVRDKLQAFERIDMLFKMVKRSKNLQWVRYEVLGGRHGDIEIIEQKKRSDRLYFIVKEAKAGRASKQDRIEQRLVSPFYHGQIYFPEKLPYYSKYDRATKDFISDYKMEFSQFPYSQHDDILDCHAQMFEELTQIRRPAKKQIVDKNRVKTYDDVEKEYDHMQRLKKSGKDAVAQFFAGRIH